MSRLRLNGDVQAADLASHRFNLPQSEREFSANSRRPVYERSITGVFPRKGGYLRCTHKSRRRWCPGIEGPGAPRESALEPLNEKTWLVRLEYLSGGTILRELTRENASCTHDTAMPSFETSSASLAISGASRPATTRLRKNSRQGNIGPANIFFLFPMLSPIQLCWG